MRAVASLFLVAVLLAGCAAPGGQSPRASPVTAPIRFGEPILVTSAPGGTENLVAVSPGGDEILTCQHNTYTGGASAATSVDRGETWAFHEPFPSQFPGGDCDVAIDPVTGTWFVTSSHAAHGAGVARSRDRGATWEVLLFVTQPTNSKVPLLANDRQWLTAVGGHAFLSTMGLYYVPNDIGMSLSHDDGATWGLTQAITQGGPDAAFTHGRTQVIDSGRVAIHPVYRHDLTDPPGGDTFRLTPLLMMSTDGGRSWTEEPVFGERVVADAFPAFAASPSGDLTWVFTNPTPDGNEVWVATRQAGRSTWTEPAKLLSAEQGPTWRNFFLDARPDGATTFVWVGEDDGPAVLAARISSDGRLVRGPMRIADAPAVPEWATVDHDASGRAVITYSDSGTVFTPAEPDPGAQYIVLESD